jgi:hypothetical protein
MGIKTFHMITGNVRPKAIAPPRGMRPYEGEPQSSKVQYDTDPFELRGIVYEEDPVKLQEIMDKTDREREALHSRLKNRL